MKNSENLAVVAQGVCAVVAIVGLTLLIWSGIQHSEQNNQLQERLQEAAVAKGCSVVHGEVICR